MQNPKQKKRIQLKPYNSKALAAIYKVSYKTFRKWLVPHREAIGIKSGYTFTYRQVQIIFEKLGLPHHYLLVEDDEDIEGDE